MTTKEALLAVSLILFTIPFCLGNTSGLYGQQLRIEVNETQTVVNLNLQVVKLGCLPIPDIRTIIVTRITFRKVRSLPNEDVCTVFPNAVQIEQVARDFMGRIRRECSNKTTTCSINVERLLAYSSDYNNIPNMRTCLTTIDWNVTHACVSKARIFGGECQNNSALTVNNPFNLSSVKTYGFVMSYGYPFWQPTNKECYWKVDQPENRYTYLVLYDIDLNWTGFQLRLRENTANGWLQFFFDDSFEWINSTLTTWQKPVDWNATAVRIGLVKNSTDAIRMNEQRGFLMYYEVQYFCTYPDLKSVWESKHLKWPPLVTGNYLMAQCDLDHVFSGTSLKMKTTQCVGKDWSPTLDVLVGAEGCRSTEGGGAVQEDLSRGSILGIIFGSLAAFLLLIGAVTLLTLKRKYHTFFPCCRKRHQKGRLPVAVQPKHTPSNASSTVYAAGFGRSESDRSNATTYTVLSNPYGPTKPISNSPDVLAASTQYAPVLKPNMAVNAHFSPHTEPTVGISASAPASQYAPTSVVSADSYGECSVYGGSLRSEYLPMHAKGGANSSARLQPAPNDDDETERLYEDPVRSPPPKHTSSSDEEYEHPISSPAPISPSNSKLKTKPVPAAKRRNSEDDNPALDEAGDRIPLAPAPPPPTSASKPAAPRVEKKTPLARFSEAEPDSEPPPPPAPKVKPIKANSDVPERPPKPLPKSSSNATRDSGEYIDFKDSSAANHRESAM